MNKVALKHFELILLGMLERVHGKRVETERMNYTKRKRANEKKKRGR